jgi:hypothetical protein
MFKKLFAVAILGATSVALAQSGTTTTTNPCTAGPGVNCTVEGTTKLVAIYPEGLTLTVPNQINFVLIKDQLNQGNQPLTAAVTWTLTGAYTDLFVDAFFKEAEPLLASSSAMGANIPFGSIEASQNGLGGTAPFGPNLLDATDPLTATDPTFAGMAFPILHTTLSGTAPTGSAAPYLNLYIDMTSGSQIYPGDATGVGAGDHKIIPSALGTWNGNVYVRATAF